MTLRDLLVEAVALLMLLLLVMFLATGSVMALVALFYAFFG